MLQLSKPELIKRFDRSTPELIKRTYYSVAVGLWSRYPDTVIPQETNPASNFFL